jgi:hypothetical protein
LSERHGVAWLLLVLVAACGNATAPEHESLPPAGPRDAAVDQALWFDGVNDYASVGSARFPQIEREQTLALWLRPEQSDGDDALQVLFTLRRSDYSGIALGLEAGVPLAFNVWGPRDLARAEEPLAGGGWQHLAYVLDAAGSHLYLGGAEVASGPAPATNRTPIAGFIGSMDGFDSSYHGALDELRGYDRALSGEEVAALARGERPGDAEALFLYLTFDEETGARSYDRSGLENHAELGDGVLEAMPVRVPSDGVQSNDD